MEAIQSIRVGPVDYEVVLEPLSEISHRGRSCTGYVSFDGLKIVMATKNPPARLFGIMWHEVVHAIDDLLHVGLEEKQVDQLGYGIMMVLRDNPALRSMPEWEKEVSAG